MRVVAKRAGGLRVRVQVSEPVVGRVRVPAGDLAMQRDAVDAVLAAAVRQECGADGAAGRKVAELLADSIAVVVEELTGEALAVYRDRFAGLARFGWALAAAEDALPENVAGLTLPQVDTALLYLAMENRAADELVKAVSDWALEAGYFLGRTGRPVPVALTRLYLDLPVLFGDRMLADQVLAERARPAAVPSPRRSPEHHVAATASPAS